jgi:hypothetical protein
MIQYRFSAMVITAEKKRGAGRGASFLYPWAEDGCFSTTSHVRT